MEHGVAWALPTGFESSGKKQVTPGWHFIVCVPPTRCHWSAYFMAMEADLHQGTFAHDFAWGEHLRTSITGANWDSYLWNPKGKSLSMPLSSRRYFYRCKLDKITECHAREGRENMCSGFRLSSHVKLLSEFGCFLALFDITTQCKPVNQA